MGVHCGQPPSCPFRPALYEKLPISSQFDNVYEEGAGFRYYELTLDLLYYFTVLGNTQEQWKIVDSAKWLPNIMLDTQYISAIKEINQWVSVSSGWKTGN